MISDHISDDIPLQMKILNMDIPILKQFCGQDKNCSHVEHYMPHKGACHPMKYDVINDIKLFPTVYHMK